MRRVAHSPFFALIYKTAQSKLKLVERVEWQPEAALKKIVYVTLNRGGRVAIKLLQMRKASSTLPVLCHYTPGTRKDG